MPVLLFLGRCRFGNQVRQSTTTPTPLDTQKKVAEIENVNLKVIVIYRLRLNIDVDANPSFARERSGPPSRKNPCSGSEMENGSVPVPASRALSRTLESVHSGRAVGAILTRGGLPQIPYIRKVVFKMNNERLP